MPTIAESGFAGFEASVWYGFIGPANLPPAITARLHAEVQKALALPEVRDRLSGAGGEVLPGLTAQFAGLLASERTRYESRALADQTGLRLTDRLSRPRPAASIATVEFSGTGAVDGADQMASVTLS